MARAPRTNIRHTERKKKRACGEECGASRRPRAPWASASSYTSLRSLSLGRILGTTVTRVTQLEGCSDFGTRQPGRGLGRGRTSCASARRGAGERAIDYIDYKLTGFGASTDLENACESVNQILLHCRTPSRRLSDPAWVVVAREIVAMQGTSSPARTDRTAEFFGIADVRCQQRGRPPSSRPRPQRTAFGASSSRVGQEPRRLCSTAESPSQHHRARLH